MLLVGAAKTNICPPLDQSRRVGKDGLATAIFGEFCARAIIISDGKNKIGIVLLDVVDFCDNITRGAREYIKKWTDVPPEKVLICATHTHASPQIEELNENTEAYINFLNRQIGSAVYLANRNLCPAQAKIGCKILNGISRPSRIRMKNGEIKCLGSTCGIKDIPEHEIESESPIDKNIRVILFEDIKGNPICGVSNFGCHNNLCLLSTTLNSDFFGYAMSKIERKFGNNFVMLATAGPQGDVQPLANLDYKQYDPIKKEILPPGRGDDLVPPAGEILYRGIKDCFNNSILLDVARVNSISRFVKFPLRKGMPEHGFWYMERRKDKGGKQTDEYAISELQLIEIGDLSIFGICGEVFTEIGLNIRKYSPYKYNMIIALANDRMLYLFPKWEYERCKKEKEDIQKEDTQFSQCITTEEAEEIIYNTFIDMIDEMRKKGSNK